MKRGIFLLFLLLFIALSSFPVSAAEYDLEISIKVEDELIAGESNEYKLFIENLDYERGQEEINAEIEYWIKKDDEILATFPKTTTANLKKQRTIKRTYKFKEGGEHEICAVINEANYPDPEEDNNYFCLEVEVGGEEEDEKETEEEKESDEETEEESEEEEPKEEEELKEVIKEEGEIEETEKEQTSTPIITTQTTREYKSKDQNLKPIFIGLFVVLCISLILIIIFKKSKV